MPHGISARSSVSLMCYLYFYVFFPNLYFFTHIWKKNMSFLSKSILFTPHLEEKHEFFIQIHLLPTNPCACAQINKVLKFKSSQKTLMFAFFT